ncbi:MAG: aromatic amino acid hydroxylase, partial [Flavobacteriales bacterium]
GIDRIPDIEYMNKVLARIGWGAVCVDGFIPPQAFMEFQAHNVLAIAEDIRRAEHLEYTPAPDIIHEAAGHAPIIADPEYAEYLRLFGEIGARAFSSKKDFTLYEAIRHLSIVKENAQSSQEDISRAEEELEAVQNNMGAPSEMARIRNLHWWTVEYGLIGTLEKPLIYGAGLLSSTGESVACLHPDVKKIPYSIRAADCSFDITTEQPQLFITQDFSHLTEVLNEFADGMALRKGSMEGVNKAIASGATATCVLSSGLQITGVFSEALSDNDGHPAYIWTSGPSMLCEDNKMLPGHGKTQHADGYGTPVGKLKNSRKPLELLSTGELSSLGIRVGTDVVLLFESGVRVEGRLRTIRKNKHGTTLLMSFDSCSVTFRRRVLFEPSWGIFDMGTGAAITSVFPGPADTAAFGLQYPVPAEHTPTPIYSEEEKQRHAWYEKAQKDLENHADASRSAEMFAETSRKYPSDFLLLLEIYENLFRAAPSDKHTASARRVLKELQNKSETMNRLITDGLNIIENTQPT